MNPFPDMPFFSSPQPTRPAPRLFAPVLPPSPPPETLTPLPLSLFPTPYRSSSPIQLIIPDSVPSPAAPSSPPAALRSPTPSFSQDDPSSPPPLSLNDSLSPPPPFPLDGPCSPTFPSSPVESSSPAVPSTPAVPLSLAAPPPLASLPTLQIQLSEQIPSPALPSTPNLQTPIPGSASSSDAPPSLLLSPSPNSTHLKVPMIHIARIMRNAVPDNGKLSSDARAAMQEHLHQFLVTFTAKARECAKAQRCQVVRSRHVLEAFNSPQLRSYHDILSTFRHILHTRPFSAASSPSSGGHPESAPETGPGTGPQSRKGPQSGPQSQQPAVGHDSQPPRNDLHAHQQHDDHVVANGPQNPSPHPPDSTLVSAQLDAVSLHEPDQNLNGPRDRNIESDLMFHSCPEVVTSPFVEHNHGEPSNKAGHGLTQEHGQDVSVQDLADSIAQVSADPISPDTGARFGERLDDDVDITQRLYGDARNEEQDFGRADRDAVANKVSAGGARGSVGSGTDPMDVVPAHVEDLDQIAPDVPSRNIRPQFSRLTANRTGTRSFPRSKSSRLMNGAVRKPSRSNSSSAAPRPTATPKEVFPSHITLTAWTIPPTVLNGVALPKISIPSVTVRIDSDVSVSGCTSEKPGHT